MVPVPASFTFIVGCGRSGTTLLRAILDAHSELAIAHESRFITWMLDHRARYGKGGLDADRFLDDLTRNPRVPSRFPDWGVDVGTVRAELTAATPTTLPEAIRVVYRCYAQARGKHRAGDKTPRYVQHVGQLGAEFPEARFVHIIRDGRDVALALGDVDFGAADPVEAAFIWKRKVSKARREGKALGAARYEEVRYEDLVDDPGPVVQGICRFLGLRFEPTMLEFHRRVADQFAGFGRQVHHQSLDRPVTKGLRDWRTQLPADSLARYEAVAGDLLAELGYETSRQPSDGWLESLGLRARFVRGRLVAHQRARARARRGRR